LASNIFPEKLVPVTIFVNILQNVATLFLEMLKNFQLFYYYFCFFLLQAGGVDDGDRRIGCSASNKGEGWGLGFWCCWTLMGRLLVYSSFVFYLPEDV
jgi:hypothetical protein